MAVFLTRMSVHSQIARCVFVMLCTMLSVQKNDKKGFAKAVVLHCNSYRFAQQRLWAFGVKR